ncbi:hypothetical protein CMUS01_16138 [Colletotrichum musicola]|uniref:Apple domain-containing protein n=1 Tax=Colletotrichum musicola TaxID=2175873 RepID=A0A8H6IR61_9PEZI|nr:hypothetical protein CMUS01_16138 [Colletotrichum musicola]
MRSALLLAAAAGIASANPVTTASPSAQTGIDLSVFDAQPKLDKVGPAVGASTEKPTYNPAEQKAAAAQDALENPIAATNTTLKARDSGTCTNANQEPAGAGPMTSPDTFEAFMTNPVWDNIAQSAPVPDGYSLAFSDLSGSVEGQSYEGLYTMQSYDTIKCQQYCDAAPACWAFNVFIERDPALTPSDSCVDPPSTANYKCTLWGAQVSSSSATNVGQWRNNFHVGIRGSNGFNKLAPPPSQPSFTGPIELGGSIQAPYSYIGSRFFAGIYDPGQCTGACQGTTQYDHDHPRDDGSYDACNFVNSYVLSENGAPQGTFCALYTQAWDKSYSTNVGQWRGSDYYSVSQSYGWTLSPLDPGHI